MRKNIKHIFIGKKSNLSKFGDFERMFCFKCKFKEGKSKIEPLSERE
jgi:hypothetical protein